MIGVWVIKGQSQPKVYERVRQARPDEMLAARYWIRLIIDQLVRNASQHRITEAALKRIFDKTQGNPRGSKKPQRFQPDKKWAYARLIFGSDSNFRKCLRQRDPHSILHTHISALQEVVLDLGICKQDGLHVFGPASWIEFLQHCYRAISDCPPAEFEKCVSDAPCIVTPETDEPLGFTDRQIESIYPSELTQNFLGRSPLCIGRSQELEAIVERLNQTVPASFHAIIGGPPGIGKTTLSKELTGHSAFVAVYGANRHFVELENARTIDDFRTAILSAAKLPLDSGEPLSKQIRTNYPGAFLLILDNLETPWDQNRPALEQLLIDLVAHDISILATIRGLEAPALPWQIQISLSELQPESAKALFLTYAPSLLPSDPSLNELLDALGGHPLAIVLMGLEAAPFATCERVLAAWKRVGTRLAKRRELTASRLTSLEHSVSLSIASTKRHPESKRLFIIAGFTYGSLDIDTCEFLLGDKCYDVIRDLLASGLAYENGYRIALLPPLAQYARDQQLLNEDDIDQLTTYYFNLAKRLASAPSLSERECRRLVEHDVGTFTRIALFSIHRRVTGQVLAAIDCFNTALKNAQSSPDFPPAALVKTLTISSDLYAYAGLRQCERRRFHEAYGLAAIALDRKREQINVMYSAMATTFDQLESVLSDEPSKVTKRNIIDMVRSQRERAREIFDLGNLQMDGDVDASLEMRLDELYADDDDKYLFTLFTENPLVQKSLYVADYSDMGRSSIHHVGIQAFQFLNEGDAEASIAKYREYATAMETLFGKHHAWTALALDLFARTCFEADHLADAEAAFSQIAEIEEVVICPRDFRTSHYLGCIASKFGRLDEAKQHFTDSYRSLRLTLPADNEDVAASRDILKDFDPTAI